MAEEEKLEHGSERQRKLYKNERSKKQRGDAAEKPESESEPPAAPSEPERVAAEPDRPAGQARRGGHAAEREAQHQRHHEDRRRLMAEQLRQHRDMDAEHEKQHQTVKDHAGLVGLHRDHLERKRGLDGKHRADRGTQEEQHHRERMQLAQKHEAEMMAEAQGAGAGAAAAPGQAPMAAAPVAAAAAPAAAPAPGAA